MDFEALSAALGVNLMSPLHEMQVVEEGAWAEGVTAALSRLGVHVLNSSVLPLADMGCVRSLVNAATGSNSCHPDEHRSEFSFSTLFQACLSFSEWGLHSI